MKKYLTQDTLLSTYYVFFIVCLLAKLVSINHEYFYSFDMSEWLINYQGGFIRRGLKGEMLLSLYKNFGIKPYTVVSLLCNTSFLVLAFILFKKFINKGYSIFVLPFVFFLSNVVINYGLMKIDSILLLVFISIVYLLNNKPKFYLIGVNILFILTFLLHEAFIFFSFPVVFLLISYEINKNKDRSKIKSYLSAFMWLLPSFIVFLALFIFKGDKTNAIAIWESLRDVPFYKDSFRDYSEPLLAIESVGYTMKESWDVYTGQFVRSFGYGIYGPLMICIIIVAIYFILSNINRFNNKILGQKPKDLMNKPIVSAVLLFQFCTTIPLYALGCDTSRWIYYWVISSFILLLFLPDKVLGSVFPNIVYTVTNKINSLLLRLLGNSKSLIILMTIMIGYPLVGWKLQYGTEASSLYMVLKNFSGLIRLIFKFFNIDMVEYY